MQDGQEYGDRASPMGSGLTCHNVPQGAKLGWYDPLAQLDVQDYAAGWFVGVDSWECGQVQLRQAASTSTSTSCHPLVPSNPSTQYHCLPHDGCWCLLPTGISYTLPYVLPPRASRAKNHIMVIQPGVTLYLSFLANSGFERSWSSEFKDKVVVEVEVSRVGWG